MSAWPIAIGKIKFKRHYGPISALRRKEAIRTFVKLTQIGARASLSVSGKE